MHHGTCVTHVPWCMSGSLTRGGGNTFPELPAHAQPIILCIWWEAHGKFAYKVHTSSKSSRLSDVYASVNLVTIGFRWRLVTCSVTNDGQFIFIIYLYFNFYQYFSNRCLRIVSNADFINRRMAATGVWSSRLFGINDVDQNWIACHLTGLGH